MMTLERITRWMERNLEQPFYQAEIARAQVQSAEPRNSKKAAYKGHRHGKVAMRTVK